MASLDMSTHCLYESCLEKLRGSVPEVDSVLLLAVTLDHNCHEVKGTISVKCVPAGV